MHTTTGAIWGRRRGVADGLTPGSMVISLTLGILKGEGPDAAASAGRFVSLAPEDAFESENLLIAPNPCSAVGTGCGSRTLRNNWEQYAAANHLHLHVRNESIDAFPRTDLFPHAYSLTRSTATSSSISFLRLTGPRSVSSLIRLISTPVRFDISRIAAPTETR